MRARQLRGKTIAQVYQRSVQTNAGRHWVLVALEFTDGSVMRFVVDEREDGYAVEGIYPARAIEPEDRERYETL